MNVVTDTIQSLRSMRKRQVCPCLPPCPPHSQDPLNPPRTPHRLGCLLANFCSSRTPLPVLYSDTSYGHPRKPAARRLGAVPSLAGLLHLHPSVSFPISGLCLPFPQSSDRDGRLRKFLCCSCMCFPALLTLASRPDEQLAHQVINLGLIVTSALMSVHNTPHTHAPIRALHACHVPYQGLHGAVPGIPERGFQSCIGTLVALGAST